MPQYKSQLVRFAGNPLFRPEEFPYGIADQVFNPGQVMTPDGRTILLLSVLPRGERLARLFGNGQCVDVRPVSHRMSALLAPDVGDEAGVYAAEADPQRLETGGDIVARLEFLLAEFGHRV